MLECIDRVLNYCQGDEGTFRHSRLIQDAVIRNLQIMAESSQRLSADAKSLAPEVPWRSIAGFRNMMVHGYLGIDLDVIWQVISKNLVPLREGILKIKSGLGQ